MTSELLIHIGTHKTATTMIQNTLAHNRAELVQQGLSYPKLGRANGHHVLATPWIKTLPPVYHSTGDPRSDWARLPKGHRYTFLSSEELSRAHPDRVDMNELRDLVSQFDRVRVLCVLRNQIDFMQSAYLEVMKKQDLPPIEEYVSQLIAHPQGDNLFVDPNALLTHLLTGFDKSDLIFMPYSALKTHVDGPLGAIFERLGWSVDVSCLKTVAPDQENRSMNPLTAWVAHQVSRPRPSSPALRATVARELSAQIGSGPTCLFSRPERRSMIDLFAPLNQKFEKTIHSFDPGFKADPLDAGEHLLHRDQLTGPIWFRIARALYADQTLPKQDATRRLA